MNKLKLILECRLIIYFVSVAAVAWAEMRRQWVGQQAEVSKKAPREPVIRFNVLIHLPAS
jgi:hypothetical protein